MNLEDRIWQLVFPIVDDLGLELVDVVYGGSRLTVTIDDRRALGTDLLTRATRLISRELDAQDPIPRSYTLEVSSPGLERSLRKPGHFQRAIGEQVLIKMLPGVEPRRIRGQIDAADDQAVIVLSVDAAQHTVRYEDISKAKTTFTWDRGFRPGQQSTEPLTKPTAPPARPRTSNSAEQRRSAHG